MTQWFFRFWFNFLVFIPSLLLSQQIIHLGAYEGVESGAVRVLSKDSLGYVWIGTSQGLSRYSGTEFKAYDTSSSNKGIVDLLSTAYGFFALASNGNILEYDYKRDQLSLLERIVKSPVLCFTAIDDETLLIGLQEGMLLFNLKTKKISKVLHVQSLFNRKILVKEKKVYVASTKGINVYNLDEEHTELTYHKTLLKGIEILDFALDFNNQIWAGTYQKGVFVISNDKAKKLNLPETKTNVQTIRSITFDKFNQALIAVEGTGLFVVSQDFEVVNNVIHDPDKLESLRQNSIYEIFVDETNVYWLGLRELGIDLIYPNGNPFTHINYVPYAQNSISNNNIRSIYFCKGKRTWFGTENGVSVLLPSGKWINYNSHPLLSKRAVLTINPYGSRLLLSVYGEGMVLFDPATGKVERLRLQENQKKSRMVFTTYVDGDELWIGGFDGPVKHFEKGVLVKNYVTGNARTIIKGEKNTIYVGSPNGFYEINKETQTIKRIDGNQLRELNQIHALFYDEINRCIWIGNKRGLLTFDLVSQQLSTIQKSIDYSLGTIYSIQKDNNEHLWLSTYNGLWKYNTITDEFRKYDVDEGLLISTFGFGATAKSDDGSLAFGGPLGAVIFNQEEFPEELDISNIYITNFRVNGLEAGEVIEENNINFLQEINLEYNQNSISFDFEVPTYHGSKVHTYQWQLQGYDKVPKSSKNPKNISYPKLEPGKYILQGKAINEAGNITTKSLDIRFVIGKPFWLSNWAILGYITIGFLISILFINARITKEKQKFNENKIKFFTEVAHDIRTPVSLIQLLASQLSTSKKNFEKNIDLIQKNTQNLNEYVTQLLDFQKAERNMLKLEVRQIKLKTVIDRIVQEVQPLLNEKSIDIAVSIANISVWVDEKMITRIFYNLISNAIKYSPDGGKIQINATSGNDKITIDFIDYGYGIPAKEQQLIFSRFTRGTNVNNKGISGSGIGLMISKKIIELHGGEIKLVSKENIGSKFSVILRIGSEHFATDDFAMGINDDFDTSVFDNNNEKKLILLVEDNADLRNSIKDELASKYKVITAENGKEGLLIALSKNPDLIITDVMMPKMDGKEMCRVIKSNFQTSHIPVIIVSALGEVDDKVEGIEIGADGYLEKPFNMKLLNAMALNLINSRALLKQVVGEKQQLKDVVKSPDKHFLSKVVKIIEDNLTNQKFSIDNLSDETGLSRSNLFRKLKGLTGMSPNDFVTQIKMNYAAQLLKNNKGIRISDVAYESGYNDPRYFSTLFKKFYGKTPKQFMSGGL